MINPHFVKTEPVPFYVGTYTHGESEGIYKYLLHHDGSLTPVGLAVKSDNPSFLALSSDKQFLIAVNEIDLGTGSGTVQSFSLDGDQLKPISQRSSGGNNPCFVAINKAGDVLVANYTGGSIGYLKLDEKGALTNTLDIQHHVGIGVGERRKHLMLIRPGLNLQVMELFLSIWELTNSGFPVWMLKPKN